MYNRLDEGPSTGRSPKKLRDAPDFRPRNPRITLPQTHNTPTEDRRPPARDSTTNPEGDEQATQRPERRGTGREHQGHRTDPNHRGRQPGQTPQPQGGSTGDAGEEKGPGEPPPVVTGPLSFGQQGSFKDKDLALTGIDVDLEDERAMSNSHDGTRNGGVSSRERRAPGEDRRNDVARTHRRSGERDNPDEDRANRASDRPRSFLYREVRATKSELDIIEEVLSEAYGHRHRYRKVARHLLAHIYFCQVRPAFRSKNAGVPIGYQLIKSACRRTEGCPVPERTEDVWAPLKRSGFLAVDQYLYGKTGKNRSRRFRLSRTLFGRLTEASEKARGQKTRYDLVSGRRVRKRKRTSLTHNGRHSWKERSPFMHRTLKVLKGQRDLVNVEAVEAHLDRLRNRSQEAKALYEKAKSTLVTVKNQVLHEGKTLNEEEKLVLSQAERETYMHGRGYDRSLARYAQDSRIWSEINAQGLEKADDQPPGIYQYETAYEVQEASGRLTMTCGLQNASREMKAAAAQGIPEYRNYDISSSQTAALTQEMEQAATDGADILLSTLTEYPGKDYLARTYGVERDKWKRPEHAVKFGAGFSHDNYEEARGTAEGRVLARIRGDDGEPRFDRLHHLDHENGKMAWERAVYNELPTMAQVARDWADDNKVPFDDPEEIYTLLKTIFGPMAKAINGWREWLLTNHWPKHSRGGGRHGSYVKNPCGFPFSIHEDRLEEDGKITRYAQKAAYATSRLQGLEAAYMHSLAIIAEDYGYEFLRNEHDGAVVIGRVPEEARKKARKMSGFYRARLEEKPYEEENERRRPVTSRDGGELGADVSPLPNKTAGRRTAALSSSTKSVTR